MRDWAVNGDWFYRNCQFISEESEVKNIFKNLGLYNFPVRFSSYVDLFGKELITNNFQGPVYDEQVDKITLSTKQEKKSLKNRLSQYPEKISSKLIEWIKYLGFDPTEAYENLVYYFGLDRVYLSKHTNDLKEYKKNSLLADTLYGLPNNFLGKKCSSAYLPQKGYSNFFDQIKKTLEKIKIIEKPNIDLPSEILEGLKSTKEKVPDAKIFWTASPVILNKAFGFNKLLSKPVVACNSVLYCKNPFNSPFYIQVFSLKTRVTRIYFYENKATIEWLPSPNKSDNEEASVLEFFKLILNKLSGTNFKVFNILKTFKETRFMLTNYYDLENLTQISNQAKNLGLICTPWHFYGRDAKISYFKSYLK